MSIWVEELKDFLTEEEYEAYKELKEEEKMTKKMKKKVELLQKYKDKFSDEVRKKYGVV